MNGNHGQLEAAAARITPEGILFRDRYYTCRLALRYKWYEQALARGPWEIRVLFHPAEERPEALYIDSEHFEEERVCHFIGVPLQPSETAAYHTKLRKLADERKMLYGNKTLF
ncbi:MAG: hypothetical protein K0Q90_4211 [Paenibacillaceae bacterium]|jgi:hypothetical protein|nr:hypothetical protein [Paenibacillaceae bacterium]